jgi:hypothetical protein
MADKNGREPVEFSSESLAKSLASQIVLIAVYETPRLAQAWAMRMTDEEQVKVFTEYSAFLVALVDRFALRKFAEPRRSKLTNAVIDNLEGTLKK